MCHQLTRLSWAFLIAYGSWEFGLKGVAFHFFPIVVLNFTEQLLLAGFFVTHARAYYSGVEVAVFAACSVVVSNAMENLSILTGFPFGYYYHTPLAGPKLFNVPVLVTLVYLGLGYVSWMVTQVLLRRTRPANSKSLILVAPLVAAFVFSAWDLCIDPIYGTIYRAFIYQSPGAWFGTPVGNYFGWLLTTYLFYLLFSWFLASLGGGGSEEPKRLFWLQPIVVYAITALGIILGNLSGPHVAVTVANGRVWNTGDIYGASTVVTLFTMVFISLLAGIGLYQREG